MLFDPGSTKGMMVFFVLSLGLGWVHLFFGRIIAFIRKIQTEGIMAAIFDQLSWMIVMVGVLFLMLGMVKSMFGVNFVVPAYFGKIGMYLFLGGLAIVLVFGGRAAKTIIGKLGSGLFEVYGVSGLMGDILSYARLFALGLATGVIAGVFNQLALMMKGIGGIAGIILFIVLLIVGHLFNIAMNALGAFIHTLRLQFVEFFTKFYEGGGEEFSPLKRELKYIMVEKENIQ
jgi:V/A-type H+-transporting ATPase subunit I